MEGRELKRTLDIHTMIGRAYRDDRFPASGSGRSFREFVITAIWVTGIERPPKGERLKRVADLLGLTDWRFKDLIASDVPRWEPEDTSWRWGDRPCPAPMIRRAGTCDRNGNHEIRVTDPATGQWRREWYCSRHHDAARQVEAHQKQLRDAGGIPDPLPNRGGLGPCYLSWNWPDQYAAAKPGWKPPKVGICADDWPVMAKVVNQPSPTLAVLAGDGEAADWDGEAPGLKLLPGGFRG